MIPDLRPPNGNSRGVAIPASLSSSAPASSEQKACTTAEARDLTERIKATAEQVWALLLEAHDRRAWKALGYESWRTYAAAEFDMSQSYAYRVLDQAKVIQEITAAADFAQGRNVSVSEREARDIKPVLAEVTADIREQVATMPDRDPARVRQVVQQSVVEARQRVQAHRTDGGERQLVDAGQDDSTEVVEAEIVSAPAQRSPHRPLTDAFFDAAYDLTKAVDRLARLVADDRFPRNAEQVVTKHRSDLLRTADVLADVINRVVPMRSPPGAKLVVRREPA